MIAQVMLERPRMLAVNCTGTGVTATWQGWEGVGAG